MSDLAALVQRLETALPALRRQLMRTGDWEKFVALLGEAAPLCEKAIHDPDARLEALYKLERALGQFEATRRILPPPVGSWVEPPSPQPDQTHAGLPTSPVAQRQPDIAELLRRATTMCRDPNAAANRSEAAGQTEEE